MSTMNRPEVLIVDDDPRIRDALQRALTLKGFAVRVAVDGDEALDNLAIRTTDVVVLDVTMPGVDGLEVCRRLRASGDRVPILMLTARDGVAERVAGLDIGADDYLVKPFALEELVARLGALIRRTGVGEHHVYRFADLVLDTTTYEVRRGQHLLGLTRSEFRLLEALMANPRRVLTKEVLLDRMWGTTTGIAPSTLPMLLSSLRRKIEDVDERRLIHTVRGVGYVLREDAP